MNNHRIRVEGEFAFPTSSTIQSSDVRAAATFAAVIGTGLSWALTCWFAARLAYRAALGTPWFHYASVPIYAPWSWYVWRQKIALHFPSASLVTSTKDAPLILLALSVLSGTLIFYKRHQRRTNRADELHGSAHKARPDEVDKTGLVPSRGYRARAVRWLHEEPLRYGVILGMWQDPRSRVLRLLRDISTRHVMVIAPPRSGKGVGIVIPTLVTCRDSAVVNDPKGELYRDTAGRRQALGQHVHLFAPAAEIGRSAKWNALSAVRLGTSREIADAQQIATIALSETKGGSSDGNVWTLAARDPFTACILHVLYRARARKERRASLPSVLRELKNPTRSYEEVLEEWSTYPHDPTYEFGWTLPDGSPTKTHPLVAATAIGQLNLDEKVRSSVKFTLDAALALYEDHRLQANLDGDDFFLEDLVYGTTSTTVYVQYPMADVERLGPVLRLFYELLMLRSTEDIDKLSEKTRSTAALLFKKLGGQRLLQALVNVVERLTMRRVAAALASVARRIGLLASDAALSPTRRKRQKLLMMLDEFPNLGRMRAIEAALPVCPGFGIRVVIIIQGWEQLRSVYGKDETITPVMHTRIAFAPNTYETAKVLSEMCGRSTARQITKRGSLFSKRVDTDTEQLVARALYQPDELLRLPGPKMDESGERIVAPGKVLVFAAGAPVIEAQQLLFWEDRNMLAWTQTPAPAAPHALPLSSNVRTASAARSAALAPPAPPPTQPAPPTVSAPQTAEARPAAEAQPLAAASAPAVPLPTPAIAEADPNPQPTLDGSFSAEVLAMASRAADARDASEREDDDDDDDEEDDW